MEGDRSFAQLFEHSREPAYVIDPLDDRILAANRAGCAMLGYTLEELLTTPVSQIHPAELPQMREFLDQVLRDGQGSTIKLTCRTKIGTFLPRRPSLPLYKGKANGQTVWYVLLDASDAGLAHDLGVNYAPKLANIGINDPEAVQTVALESPTPDQNKFGQAVVDFQGAPDFSPTRIAQPGPNGFPLANFQPGAVAGPGYSPFIRIAGSNSQFPPR